MNLSVLLLGKSCVEGFSRAKNLTILVVFWWFQKSSSEPMGSKATQWGGGTEIPPGTVRDYVRQDHAEASQAGASGLSEGGYVHPGGINTISSPRQR
jgi:hypothetical protein